jgi:uncharacterized protein (DUF433 family)
MAQAAAVESIPLMTDPQGVLRIVGTQVTLDTVVEVYNAGGTPEEIAQRYPPLQLADVYAVLTYYLRHKEGVDAYLLRRQKEATKPAINLVAEERSELLARKHGGERLSLEQQERLETLTARLKEALPPVSVEALEVLLKMTEEMQQVRERAQERQRRVGLGRTDERPL